jgi:glycosyltransferase involved in cell wall biosynthesis
LLSACLMKILIPSFSFPAFEKNNFDGKFVFSEAIAYAENGATVTVLTPHYPGVSPREIIDPGIEVVRFPYFFPRKWQRLKKPGEPIYNQKSLLSLIQIPFLFFIFTLLLLKYSRKIDIVHAQWTVTALLALPAKWIFRKKIVVTARGSDLRLLPGWLNRFIHARVDAAIDCFGPQPWNREYKRKFPAFYIKLPLIVHNEPVGIIPVDMQKAIEAKPDTFVILYIGRFDYFKLEQNKLPLLDLIRASRNLVERKADFHVFYIGDGDKRLKNDMENLVKQYSLHEYVTFLGGKTNVPDYISFCHIGIGGVAFNGVSQELTINGKPQLLVDGDDNADMPWQDGENALFFKAEDLDLAKKLIWAIDHRDIVEQIGRKAKAAMSQYIADSKSGGAQYIKEFHRLLESPDHM